MRALLLSAGFGTRLRPITDHVPKCLVPIHGKPLLGYWLDMLLPQAIERVLINTHYLPDAVRAFVADSRWLQRIDMIHEAHLLGTGGTVLKNRAFFGNEAFMVVHADNLSRFDVEAFIKAHVQRPAGVDITMMTFATDVPKSCGIVELDPHDIVVRFHEKVENPPGNHANAAVYIFEPSVIDYLASLEKEIIDISTEVLPKYLGRMQTFHNADYHRDIGTLESLAQAEREF
ncbi:MAG: D-glycero-alpha-D-manno-heptose 1-phosphate guanylyltransferase [Betaproteobacteria bacterium ADurb.Bin341]|nr:MAG: D-glycero-alpha-D-manno-heptose 1-phosphate guanylyltransferase [Betaproteobacteria bacterium ADurb.Bin341]